MNVFDRNVLLAAALTAAGAGLAAPAETLRTTVRGADGRAQEEVRRTIRFPNATLSCIVILDGTNFVKGGAIGLEFGRQPRTNGGWSLWSFLDWRLRRRANGPSGGEPSRFQAIELDGAVVADMVWSAAAGKGATSNETVALRMIQDRQDPNWIYLRIGFSATGIVEYLNLNAYPGNPRSAVFPPEGERWVATRQETHCLSRAPFTPRHGTDVLVWYNVFAYENTGCAIVLIPDDFGELASSGDYGVGARLHPAAGRREVHLAIGQFTDEPASTWLPRFLGEQADAVGERLRSMDWNPRLPPGQFARQAVLTDKLLAGLDASDDAFRHEFEALRAAYRQAEAAEDMQAALAAANALDDLNERIAQAGLASLK